MFSFLALASWTTRPLWDPLCVAQRHCLVTLTDLPRDDHIGLCDLHARANDFQGVVISQREILFRQKC